MKRRLWHYTLVEWAFLSAFMASGCAALFLSVDKLMTAVAFLSGALAARCAADFRRGRDEEEA